MQGKNLRTQVLLFLGLLAAAQLAILFHRQRAGFAASSQWLAVGDTLTPFKFEDSLGEVREISSGGPTVLLVFDPACGHTQRVAPIWANWMKSHGEGIRVLAVSNAGPAAAEAYAREHRWDVEVLSVRSEGEDLEDPLMRRTPWVFVLNEKGVVVSEGHGARVAELTISVFTLAEAWR